MRTVTGTLRTIRSKSGVSKVGPWTAYSLGVDEGSGALEWFRHGFNAPTVNEGSRIIFQTVEEKPGVFKIEGDVVVDKSSPVAAAPATYAAPPPDNRQNSIVRQNSTGHAARIVSDMCTHGIIVLKGTTGKKFDQYLEYVTEVTNRIFLVNIQPPSAEDIIAASAVDSVPTMDTSDDDVWGEE